MLDSSVLTLLVRLVVSLGIVIGLMVIAAGILRKRGIVLGGGGTGSSGKSKRGPKSPYDLDIVARRGLGRNAQLAVVRTAGKTLVLGITENQITMLAEADSFDDGTPDAYELTNDGIVIDSPEAQRTALPRSSQTGTFPTWKTLVDSIRDKTVRH